MNRDPGPLRFVRKSGDQIKVTTRSQPQWQHQPYHLYRTPAQYSAEPRVLRPQGYYGSEDEWYGHSKDEGYGGGAREENRRHVPQPAVRRRVVRTAGGRRAATETSPERVGRKRPNTYYGAHETADPRPNPVRIIPESYPAEESPMETQTYGRRPKEEEPDKTKVSFQDEIRPGSPRRYGPDWFRESDVAFGKQENTWEATPSADGDPSDDSSDGLFAVPLSAQEVPRTVDRPSLGLSNTARHRRDDIAKDPLWWSKYLERPRRETFAETVTPASPRRHGRYEDAHGPASYRRTAYGTASSVDDMVLDLDISDVSYDFILSSRSRSPWNNNTTSSPSPDMSDERVDVADPGVSPTQHEPGSGTTFNVMHSNYLEDGASGEQPVAEMTVEQESRPIKGFPGLFRWM